MEEMEQQVKRMSKEKSMWYFIHGLNVLRHQKDRSLILIWASGIRADGIQPCCSIRTLPLGRFHVRRIVTSLHFSFHSASKDRCANWCKMS